jgi:hypothetical protein
MAGFSRIIVPDIYAIHPFIYKSVIRFGAKGRFFVKAALEYALWPECRETAADKTSGFFAGGFIGFSFHISCLG